MNTLMLYAPSGSTLCLARLLPSFLSCGHLFTAVLEVVLSVLDKAVVTITAGYKTDG